MAFVLIQHLAPDHKSILTDLVERYTRMRVYEFKDGVKFQPDCTYIIPPNRDMALLNGTLQLLDPTAARGVWLSAGILWFQNTLNEFGTPLWTQPLALRTPGGLCRNMIG